MTTQNKYTNIVQKRLMGLKSWKDYFFDYLKLKSEAMMALVFDKDGTFGATKVAITSPGNDQLDIALNKFGIDGSGHIFNLAGEGSWFEDVPFENQTGNDYDYGVHYAEKPAGVQINARTGKPEYQQFEETHGIADDPASVTDQGGGVIRLRLPTSMCAADRTHVGRTALVWKKVPADGALTEAIAVEALTVVFSTYNYIDTSSGSLGQTTISTTASDYTVLLLGPTIARTGDLDIEAAADFWYIGEITGNGPAATPTVFDITDQRLIEHTLSDVISYSGGSAWYDGTTNPATTIEAQLDKIINDLIDDTGVAGPNASGAHKIGAAAQADSPESLTQDSIGAQLLELLEFINDKGHIAVANTWSQKQTFAGNGTDPQIRFTPKGTTLAANGDCGVDTGGSSTAEIRLQGSNRVFAEEQLERTILFPLTAGAPQDNGGAEWLWKYAGYWQDDGGAGRQFMHFSLNRILPQGSKLIRARAYFVPGQAEVFADRADRARIFLEKKNNQNGALGVLYSGFFPQPSGNDWMEVSGGVHDGGDGQSSLTDSLQTDGALPGWTVNALIGRTVYNVTDGSSGSITANTATNITATLSGGTDNDWDDEDVYRISSLEEDMDTNTDQYFIGIWSGNYVPADQIHSLELVFKDGLYLVQP